MLKRKNEDYAIPVAYVFQNDNVKVAERIVYLPIYMIMFLQKEKTTNSMVYKLNLDVLK